VSVPPTTIFDVAIIAIEVAPQIVSPKNERLKSRTGLSYVSPVV
jgi:hypothetical protein